MSVSRILSSTLASLDFPRRINWIASRWQKYPWLLLAMALTVAVAACAPPIEPRKQILGKWRSHDGLSVQFYENGTLDLRYPSDDKLGGKHDSGVWTLLPGNKIKVSAEGCNDSSAVCAVTFLGPDRLLVKGPDGASVCMTHEEGACK
jgi:hypothetical protein